jgi:hypothetical protein
MLYVDYKSTKKSVNIKFLRKDDMYDKCTGSSYTVY